VVGIPHRGPCALGGAAAFAAWLDGGAAPVDAAAESLDGAARPVSRRLNAAQAEGADLLTPDPPIAPAQGSLF